MFTSESYNSFRDTQLHNDTEINFTADTTENYNVIEDNDDIVSWPLGECNRKFIIISEA